MANNTFLDPKLDGILYTLARKVEKAQHYNGHSEDPEGYYRDLAIKEALEMAEILKNYVNEREIGNGPV